LPSAVCRLPGGQGGAGVVPGLGVLGAGVVEPMLGDGVGAENIKNL